MESKYNLEDDLTNSEYIVSKVKASEDYAQHLYAALCNNQFQHRHIFEILKDTKWSCSWRHSGGIIAEIREEGDYINWYCSGMGGDIFGNAELSSVEEGVVTDEIKQDLYDLGWVVLPRNE